jgi:hypothetical protein
MGVAGLNEATIPGQPTQDLAPALVGVRQTAETRHAYVGFLESFAAAL